MSEPLSKIRRILAATDLSRESMPAVEAARGLGSALGAEVVVLYALEPLAYAAPAAYQVVAPYTGELDERRRVEATAEVARIARRLAKRGGRFRTRLDEGLPDRAILSAARDEEADLVVLATHGRKGFQRFMIGSVVERVVRSSTRPVLVVRSGSRRTRGTSHPRRLLVAVDFSKGSIEGVAAACRLARRLRAVVVLVHVLQPLAMQLAGLEQITLASGETFQEEQERESSAALERLAKRFARGKLEVTTRLAVGVPSDVIPRVATRLRTDWIVLATHGHRGFARFLLGSVTERVLRASRKPVLVLPVRARPKR